MELPDIEVDREAFTIRRSTGWALFDGMDAKLPAGAVPELPLSPVVRPRRVPASEQK